MTGIFKKRKLRKQLKEYLNMARHARNMREDIADPKDLESLAEAESAVQDLMNGGKGNIEKAVDTLEGAANRVYPFARRTTMMEWTETIIVALGAAMAIRAFFFQPFKIPTGSMQPTLNGITVEAQAEPGFFDNPVTKFPKWLLTGASYKEIRAKASGKFDPRNVSSDRDKIVITLGGVEHRIPTYMYEQLQKQIKREYKEGDVIVSGRVIAGDHILVNKMKYNFMKPERGDISVFDTRHLDYPGVRTGTFYIKRMVGLPNEKIQIQNGRLVADGEIVSEPPMFEKIATDPMYNGGHGNDGSLYDAEQFIQLGDHHYLMMGDNTKTGMSLDGRFFGGVEREMFQGPAIFVYWPFREHWGVVH